jgi:hypothetical protein
VAIVDDIRKDRRTKNVLQQTNTKTVSAPPESTGLTGDLAPAEIFTVSDFDQVKNQVNLEEDNFQLLDTLNTMGQITNMQSTSGPIMGTGQVKQTLLADGTTGHTTVFQPAKGEIYEVCTISVAPTASGTINLSMSLEDSTSGARAVVDTGTGSVTAATLIDIVNGPLYISHECFLQSYVGTNSGGVTFDVACYRIR